jgi:hypothetical protein
VGAELVFRVGPLGICGQTQGVTDLMP